MRDALDAVGAGSLAGGFVRELSGGERQRVKMVRALAQDPRLMVLDDRGVLGATTSDRREASIRLMLNAD